MRIGLRLPPCLSAAHLAAAAHSAEQAGFDEVWFPDSQLLWRDVFSVASVAALQTSTITLGTAVTNVVTRHPSVIASAARTVGELAPGRFVLGVGIGDSAVHPAGLRQSRGTELRDAIATIRGLLAGEAVSFGPVRSRLRDPVRVPIQMAASGPRNLRLAGEIADGVILLSGASLTLVGRAIERVREGAAAAARGTIPITVSAYCRITDDLERDARALKPICMRIAANGAGPALEAVGVDVRLPATLPDVYPDLVHAEDWDAAVAACDPYINDAAAARFAQEFCLFGTPAEIVGRIRAIEATGADGIFLQHVGSYDLPTGLMRDLAERVLPQVGARRHLPQ
jgi:5,10-methylenetetrahydromethanopterin reductase